MSALIQGRVLEHLQAKVVGYLLIPFMCPWNLPLVFTIPGIPKHCILWPIEYSQQNLLERDESQDTWEDLFHWFLFFFFCMSVVDIFSWVDVCIFYFPYPTEPVGSERLLSCFCNFFIAVIPLKQYRGSWSREVSDNFCDCCFCLICIELFFLNGNSQRCFVLHSCRRRDRSSLKKHTDC